jgi:YhcG PDDEXK nuclease domain
MCYVPVTVSFPPEFAGKMNFYLSAVDDMLRHPNDGPSIGLILCKAGNHLAAEYVLRDIAKPVGLSTYVTKPIERFPRELRSSQPTVADLEAEVSAADILTDSGRPDCLYCSRTGQPGRSGSTPGPRDRAG